jgi:hypothetical protein
VEEGELVEVILSVDNDKNKKSLKGDSSDINFLYETVKENTL